MRVFDAPKTFIESLAALTGHEELESQAVSDTLCQNRLLLRICLRCISFERNQDQ